MATPRGAAAVPGRGTARPSTSPRPSHPIPFLSHATPETLDKEPTFETLDPGEWKPGVHRLESSMETLDLGWRGLGSRDLGGERNTFEERERADRRS